MNIFNKLEKRIIKGIEIDIKLKLIQMNNSIYNYLGTINFELPNKYFYSTIINSKL